MSNSIDDLLGQTESDNAEPIKPLYTVEKGDKASKWVKNAFRTLMKHNTAYFEEIQENLRLYKGQVGTGIEKTSANQRTQAEDMSVGLDKARNAKLYVNRIHDLVEWRVTTHNAAKPGIDIGPANVEYEDRIGAKVAKAVVESIWYEQDQDEIERNALRYNFIAGEHYVAVLWNPDKGDLHPDYVENLKSKKKVKLDSDMPIRIGDVEYKHFPAWRVLPEIAETSDKVTYHITWETMYVDEAKLRYKGKRDLINCMNTNDVEGFDGEFVRKLRMQDKTILITVWGKRCKYQPNGRYIVATVDGTILEDRDLPYQHDEHPLVRLTDLDAPAEQRGRSFIRNVKGMQYQHFFLTSMFAANIKLIGYPKWQIEQNSINIKELTNARTVIQRRPGSAPAQLTQPQSITPDMFNYKENLEVTMDSTVKGAFANPNALPARIDSAVALQYLSEQDSQRQHTMFSKVNAFRVKLAQITLAVAGEYYDQEDKRLIKLVGQNNEYDVKYFDFANFNRPYDIRVRSGSALPEGRAARTQAIMELVERLPEGTFTSQQILDMLDLGSTEKLFDVGTKALRAAESIVQDIITNKPVPPPEGTEDLPVYWNTFALYIQDRQFKDGVPPEVKQNMLDYLGTIEMLMWEKALKNPIFAQLMTTMPLFPMVFMPPPPPPPPMAPAEQGEQEEPGEAPEQEGPSEEELMAAAEEEQAMAAQEEQALSEEEVHAASDYMRTSVDEGDIGG